MKKVIPVFLTLTLIAILFPRLAYCQADGDYQSANSGVWTTASTWQIFMDESWVTASTPPTASSGEILIRAGHIITTGDNNINADQLTIAGTLDMNANASRTFTIANGSGIDCIVKGAMILSGTSQNMTLSSGSEVQINGTFTQTKTSSTITNNGSITITSTSGSSGSFIASSAVSAKVERYILGYSAYPASLQDDHGWHFLSSPVTAQTWTTGFQGFAPTAYDDVYKWDEPTDYWLNFKAPGVTFGQQPMVPGLAYLIAYFKSSTKIFSGTLNGTGNISSQTLTSTNLPGHYHQGWNLIGNPFPCGVNWSLCTKTGIDAIAKIWEETAASYVDISGAMGIPSMNGVMVHVSTPGGTGSVVFPTTAKVHYNDDPSWYKSTESDRLELKAIDAEYVTAQKSVIRFIEGSSNGFDKDVDSYYLSGYAPVFYSSIGNDEYLSTNSLPYPDGEAVINMGFIKNKGTTFTIEASGIESFPSGTTITLEDKKTGTFHSLVTNPVYAFTSEEGDDAERFSVHFDGPLSAGEITQSNPFTVYSVKNTLYVAAPAGVTNYQVVVSDVTGRTIFTGNSMGPGRFERTLNVSGGIYVVTILDGTSKYATKIYIAN